MWMDEWMDGWMDVWMDGRMDGRMDGWIWRDECIDELPRCPTCFRDMYSLVGLFTDIRSQSHSYPAHRRKRAPLLGRGMRQNSLLYDWTLADQPASSSEFLNNLKDAKARNRRIEEALKALPRRDLVA